MLNMAVYNWSWKFKFLRCSHMYSTWAPLRVNFSIERSLQAAKHQGHPTLMGKGLEQTDDICLKELFAYFVFLSKTWNTAVMIRNFFAKKRPSRHEAIWSMIFHYSQLLDNKIINYCTRDLRGYDHFLQVFPNIFCFCLLSWWFFRCDSISLQLPLWVSQWVSNVFRFRR